MQQRTSKILLVRLTANRNALLFLIRVTSFAEMISNKHLQPPKIRMSLADMNQNVIGKQTNDSGVIVDFQVLESMMEN